MNDFFRNERRDEMYLRLDSPLPTDEYSSSSSNSYDVNSPFVEDFWNNDLDFFDSFNFPEFDDILELNETKDKETKVKEKVNQKRKREEEIYYPLKKPKYSDAFVKVPDDDQQSIQQKIPKTIVEGKFYKTVHGGDILCDRNVDDDNDGDVEKENSAVPKVEKNSISNLDDVTISMMRNLEMNNFVHSVLTCFEPFKSEYKINKKKQNVYLLFQGFSIEIRTPMNVKMFTESSPFDKIEKKNESCGNKIVLEKIFKDASSKVGRMNLNKGGEKRIQVRIIFYDEIFKKFYNLHLDTVLLRKRALFKHNKMSLKQWKNNIFTYGDL